MKNRRMRRLRRTVVFAVAAAAVMVVAAASAGAAVLKTSPLTVTDRSATAGTWLAGDLHTHTWLTDGKNTQIEVLRNAFEFGLDYFANSEHGGQYNGVPTGLTTFAAPVWRWVTLTEYSFPIMLDARSAYPEKQLIQGLEWNVPTHEHASVGIVGAGNEPYGIGVFEYRFDEKDADTSRAGEAQKEVSHTETDTAGNPVKVVDVPGVSMDKTNATQGDMIAAVKWLDDTYSSDAYMLVNHPSRAQKWHVGDFRALNDAAPEICFGMEGLPGHQPDLYGRGGYDYEFDDATVEARARTYGGADWMIAKVGGLWDSLLAEGRNWWIVNNSDYHRYSSNYTSGGAFYATRYYDFWPGEYNKTWTYATEKTPEGIVSAARSGNAFVVNGDLIDRLTFKVTDGKKSATMGQTLSSSKGKTVTVTVAFHSPAMNANGDQVKVHHVDLIAGDVTGPLSPSSPDYTTKETESSTKILTSFSTFKQSKGWMTASFKVPVTGSMYLRLRGTNLAPGTADQTDAQGNPLVDTLTYTDVPNPDPKAAATTPTIHGNLPAMCWDDLWFYSNPIYISTP
jgi:hypothetical protein